MNIANISYASHYFNQEVVPTWIKSERYNYCENFIRLFSFLKRH